MSRHAGAAWREGEGPPILLVHGGLMSGEMGWTEQAPLAERWTLVRVDRAGYVGSAELSDVEDFALDADLLAPALEPGTHVVGHSSGAVAAMLTAARRPDAVASLTLIEPPVFHVAADDSAATRELLHRARRHWAREGGDDVDWVRDFFGLFDLPAPPDEVLEALRENARVWRGLRKPWEADLPLHVLAADRFPKLVLSGGYSEGFEDLCDVLAARIGAERDVIEGAGHGVQRTGAPFNERLERHMLSAVPRAR